MGDPLPGEIVDNIFLSVQQVTVAANDTLAGVKGDWYTRQALGTSVFERAHSSVAADLVFGQAVQSRVPVSILTTTQSIEAMASPSYVYARSGGVIDVGDLVTLNGSAAGDSVAGQSVIEATVANFAAGISIGRYVRRAIDQAGNSAAALDDIIIIKLGAA